LKECNGADFGMKRFHGRAMKVSELARVIGVSSRWIEMHMNDGTLPFTWYPIGYRTNIVDSAEVDEWLTRIAVPAGTAQVPVKKEEVQQNA
jgi:predicted DNA-binding transcriptional regulator AlpA